MRSRLLPRLLLAASALLGAVLAAEVVLHVMAAPAGDDFAFEPLTEGAAEVRGRFRKHPTRFFELAPHAAFADHHLGRYASGSWPFRNAPPEPRAPGRLRVVVLGDSCVYGVGVDAADTLVARLARELSSLGLPRAQVQVLNLGVPGYSTVQIGALLDEALATLTPDAVVLYPAAWNDQAPARGLDDVELEARARAAGALLERLRRGSRLLAWLSGPEQVSRERVVQSWEQGRPLFGPRVPPEETDRRLAHMLARVREAGLPVVVCAPAHPDSTQDRHPRVDRDARAVRRAAEAAGVPVVGGPLDAPGQRSPHLDRLFVDFVHLSPEGTEQLARAVARELRPHLQPDPRAGSGGLAVLDVVPRALSALGDERLSVTVAGLRDGDPPPVVLVGEAPLLDVSAERLEEGVRLTGLVLANAAGAHDVVVQAAQGTAVLERGVRLLEPWLEVVRGEQPVLRFHARPGDRARVFAGRALREAPQWSPRGAFRLAEPFTHVALLEAGEDGVGEMPVPPGVLDGGAVVYAQAGVFPRGEPVTESHVARWSALLTVE